MNLEKTAVVTIRASLGDGLAVSKKQAQEAWGQVLSKLGCRQDDEKISIASFIEAHRRHGEKLAGLERCLADTTRKMVQKASEGGYRDFSGLGLTFVLRRSACRVCPGVRRLAGLTIWARASTKNTGSQNMNRVAVARELVKLAKSLMAIEFDTEYEKKKYQQEHEVRPGTKLTVKKDKKPSGQAPIKTTAPVKHGPFLGLKEHHRAFKESLLEIQGALSQLSDGDVSPDRASSLAESIGRDLSKLIQGGKGEHFSESLLEIQGAIAQIAEGEVSGRDAVDLAKNIEMDLSKMSSKI
jgi:hypothetical protein